MTSFSSSRSVSASSESRRSVEQPPRRRFGLRDEPLDLGVDDARRLLGVDAALGHVRRVEERAAPPAFVVDRADRLAHAELGHHRARDVGGAQQVVLRAGRELAEDDQLGRAAAEQHGQLVLEFAARHAGSGPRSAAASCSRARRSRGRRSRPCAPDRARAASVATMAWPDFVDGDDAPHARVHRALLLEAGDDAIDRFVEVVPIDGGLVAAGREQRGLVHEVGEIGAGESGRARGDRPADPRTRSSFTCFERESAGSPRGP